MHVRAWQEAYAHLVSAEKRAGLDGGAREARWAELIGGSTAEVWVAECDDVVIGWASAGEGRDAERPRPRELEGM